MAPRTSSQDLQLAENAKNLEAHTRGQTRFSKSVGAIENNEDNRQTFVLVADSAET